MNLDVEKILYTKDEISEAVIRLGEKITRDYQGKIPLMICVLKGSVIFFSDLIRAIDLPAEIDFLTAASYGMNFETSGEVKILTDTTRDIENRDVIIVEDIIDSAVTLDYVVRQLSGRNPASLKVAALLDKPARRRVEFTADYKCFDVGNEFIVGYGLDYAERYRNLPYIGVLKT